MVLRSENPGSGMWSEFLDVDTRRIRALTRDDLPGVASLFEQVFRTGSRVPPRKLAPYFARTLLDYPGRDSDIPSLVCQDDGQGIVGFVGVHVRHLRFEGRPIRLACAGPLAVDPQARKRGLGALLLHRFLAGPQEISTTDGANNASRRLAETVGAQTAYLGSINWTRLLRPASYANDSLVSEHRPQWASALSPLCKAADWAVLGAVGDKLRPPASTAVAEELTPETMVENLPSVMASFRCHPDYTEAFLSWVFCEMERVAARGRLIRSLIRDDRGQFLGWYVYYLKPGGASWVIQVAAKRANVDAVIDHLFHHAYSNGAGAVQGRAEPHLMDALSRRRCLLRYHGGSLVHTRDTTLLGALLSRDCFLTYLEGEWWMGPHLRLS
jgi:GNAT superfamily N-acetyltransferase